jgi:hypothetical protein
MARTVSALVGVGLLVGIIYTFSRNLSALAILIGGILLVVGLLALYRQALVVMKRRKAAPLTRGILRNSAATPHTLNEPARRAKLDDLRRAFEGGIEKFRAAGKDLYTLPWYVLVGEPAAGKTEAIRRCNVGFPAGLQEYTQGTGGTLNMNWWFTNHAVILDTAGRMMFEEVQPGATSEFKEFLRLLAASRPNCPINGMLLVIPSESLIKDSADVIERKAAKIAQQLDMIQRTLGVRFPVFCIVTKCDLINGFREFFDGLDNPQLQHQMLGWSNPAPLDSVFNPENVDQHLETVRRRLLRRRYSLILDPVNTEDPSQRRIDQIDAMFTFPDSFMKIAPRLRRYMEMIFVAGEWSAKPLFLRGIYFTSSMREGSALDAELADILKVPVESLPEGKVWERERAYFLRDVFVKKVFKEKGLVTRSGNAMRLQRRRKLAVAGAGFLAVVLLFVLTWMASVQYRKDIGAHTAFWTYVSEKYKDWSLVNRKAEPPTAYGGKDLIDAEEVKTVGQFLTEVPPRVDQPLQIPTIFKFSVVLFDRGSLDEMRRQAYGIVYESAALQPALEATRKRFGPNLSTKVWDNDETVPAAKDALLELIHLETDSQQAARGEGSQAPTFNLKPLMAFDLTSGGYRSFLDDQAKNRDPKRDPVTWLYGSNESNSAPRPWPPAGLAGKVPSQETVKTGVRQFDAYWKKRVEGPTPVMELIAKLREAIKSFATEQDAFASLKAPVTTAEYATFRGEWDQHVNRVRDASKAVADLLKQIDAKAAEVSPKDPSLTAVVAAEVERINREAKSDYQKLSDAAQPLTWLKIPAAPVRATAGDFQTDLAASDAYVTSTLGIAGQPQRRYEVFVSLYEEAASRLKSAEEMKPPAWSDIPAAMETPEPTAKGVGGVIQALQNSSNPSTAKIDRVLQAYKLAADASATCRRYRIANATLPQQELNAEAVEKQIADAAGNGYEAVPPPEPIFMTKLAKPEPFKPQFNPPAAQALLGAWTAIAPYLSASEGEKTVRILDREALAPRLQIAGAGGKAYAAAYAAYWGEEVPALAQLQPDPKEQWNELPQSQASAGQINDSIEKLLATARAALEKVQAQLSTDEHISAMKSSLESSLSTLHSDDFKSASDKILNSWKQGTDVRALRAAIMKETPSEFVVTWTARGDGNDVGRRYWNQLSLHRLEMLAKEWSNISGKDFENIRRYNAFPLAPYRDGKAALTEQQLAEADKAIQSFVQAQWGSNDGTKIGGGADLKELPEPARQSLDAMRSVYRPADDPNWIENASKILQVLKSDSPVKISLLNRTRREQIRNGAVAADQNWSDITATQSGKQAVSGRVKDPDQVENRALGQISAKGGEVAMNFTHTPNGAVADRITLHAPWPGIELLFLARSALPVRNAGNQWEVEMTLGGNQSFWLLAEYPSELPALSDWPSLKP